MKKYKIIFWTSTLIIFLTMGVMPFINFFNPTGQEMMASLGYPIYASYMIAIFKIIGSLALIIPAIPKKIKEWAYAGFGIDFIGALVSLWAVNGFSGELLFPVVFMVILIISYWSNNKIQNNKYLPKVA